MSQASYVLKVSNQAAVLTSAVTSLMGPAGIPASFLLGAMPTLLQLFGADVVQQPLTVKEFRSATDEILSKITEASLRNSARDAAAQIQGTYGWYMDWDARARAGNYDEQDFRTELRDALGANSLLRAGLAALSNPQVGKFDCTHYALGAGLLMKLLLMDIAEHPNAQASGSWSVVSSNAASMQSTLGSLLSAADFEMGSLLQKWRTKNPRASNNEWLAQRDRLLNEIVGGQANLDNVKSVQTQFMRQTALADAKMGQALQAETRAAQG